MRQRTRRRPVQLIGTALASLIVGIVALLGFAQPASAADDVQLTIRLLDDERNGIPDAAINISGPDAFTADVVTDGEGIAVSPVPANSSLTVTLNEESVNQAVAGNNPTEVTILTRDKSIIFRLGEGGGGGDGDGAWR